MIEALLRNLSSFENLIHVIFSNYLLDKSVIIQMIDNSLNLA